MHTTTHTRRTQVVVRARAVHQGVCSLAVVHGWSHTNHAMCVCGVRRAICVCVWEVRDGEREERERTRVDSVGGGCGGHGARSATHQRACHHSAPLCLVPPHTHTHTQRTGRGSGHSGGGWWEWRTVVVAATPHTATTTTCPPPRVCVCVCVDGGVDSTSTASEWTKWPHTPQHPRCHHHHIHHHHQQQEDWWSGVGQKEWVVV